VDRQKTIKPSMVKDLLRKIGKTNSAELEIWRWRWVYRIVDNRRLSDSGQTEYLACCWADMNVQKATLGIAKFQEKLQIWQGYISHGYVFSERIIRVRNSLPPSIVSFESLSSFRNSLGNVNLGIYTEYWSLLLLLSLYLVLKLRLILCVLLLYACFCYCVACKWRYPPFVTLILNKINKCSIDRQTRFTASHVLFYARIEAPVSDSDCEKVLPVQNVIVCG